MPEPTPQQQDALAIIRSVLARYGVSDLTDWAWSQIVNGSSSAQVQLDLWEQPSFQRRFAGIFEFRKKFPGMTPPSPEEVINFEDTARSILRSAGLPIGFYDQPEDFVNFIAKGVSPSELSQRVNNGLVKALNAPREVQDELSRLYDTGIGGLTAYFLDPDRAMPVLERQFAAAQVGGASVRSDFGFLTGTEAERIAGLGFGGQQAEEVFGQLGRSEELFGALPGEAGVDTFDRGDILAAGFELGEEREELALRARRRAARFQGGGSFATGKEGFAGTGTAGE